MDPRLRELANATGLPLARIQQLAAQQRLHTLYDGYGQPVRQQGNRSMSGREAVLRTLERRWPKPRMNGNQAQLELLRMRGEWHLTPKQAELQRMRAGWV